MQRSCTPWCSVTWRPSSSACTPGDRCTRASGATSRTSWPCTRCPASWSTGCRTTFRPCGRWTTASTYTRWFPSTRPYFRFDNPSRACARSIVPDAQRVPGGAQRRRVHAPAPRDTAVADFRVGLPRLSETVVVAHTEQFLRSRRIPHTQRRRTHFYLLSVQRFNGSRTKRNGRRHFR